ncbi:MAG: hypothetical protein K0U37_05890 [Gammaproteobacteria bacterium]|nr:hypothetical protein [Gammaproteobacteria bacterium]
MLKKHAFSLLGGLLSFASFAGTMGIMPPPPMPLIETHPWSVTASLGYTSYEYGTAGTGQTPLGRLAIGKAFCDIGQSSVGAELGVQNGNSMRLFIPQATLDLLGGLPVTATITPMLDLLGTLKVAFASNSPVFGEVKGGLAYRRLYVLDRATINNKYQFAGEFQAGVGVPVADSSTLTLLYQGIWGGNLTYTANAASGTGNIANIPIQNGILLSLNITL